MRLLLDTHVLLWASMGSSKLTESARRLLDDPGSELLFSAVSIWEIAIKNRLGRPHFKVEPLVLRDGLLRKGYGELAITSVHGAATEALPLLHHDPFDRLLIAQATSEGLVLVTSDKDVLRYEGPIRSV